MCSEQTEKVDPPGVPAPAGYPRGVYVPGAWVCGTCWHRAYYARMLMRAHGKHRRRQPCCIHCRSADVVEEYEN